MIKKKKSKYSFQTEENYTYFENRKKYLKRKYDSTALDEIADGFPKYAKRQEITRFLARHELFKKVLEREGSIVECGVYNGNGLFSWAALSAIYEPIGGINRSVIGFDTFSGFPSVHKKDTKSGKLKWKKGDVSSNSFEDINESIKLFDQNRFLNQFNKIEVVKGDFLKTGKKFIKDNPHLVVSLLFLDFDIYSPTKEALKIFLPRMPKGSIIVFDEINHPLWPGETEALLECMDINKKEIKRFSFEVNMSYLIV